MSDTNITDIRFFKDIENIQDNEILPLLKLLNVKKFKNIENNNIRYGVISQMIPNNYLNCITIDSIFVPNINKNVECEIIEENYYKINTEIDINLEKGDLIKWKMKENDVNENLRAIVEKKYNNHYYITLQNYFDFEINNMYLYGRLEHDVNIVNKQVLYDLNICASIELNKMLEWHSKGIDKTQLQNAKESYGESIYNTFESKYNKIIDILKNNNINTEI